MTGVGARFAIPLRMTAALLAVAAAAGSLAIATGPGHATTYAGVSAAGAALTVAAGLGLVLAGVVTTLAGRATRLADLSLAAGLLWFAPVWTGWQDGPPVVRTATGALGGLAFPLLLHLVLAYPTGRLRSRPATTLVAVAYLEAVTAAVLLALFRDPYLDPSCWADCDVKNVFLVNPLPTVALGVETADRWLTFAEASALAILVAIRLRASVANRLREVRVLVPSLFLVVAVVARSFLLQSRTVESPFNPAFFYDFALEAIAVTALSVILVADSVGAYRQRRALGGVIAALDDAPAPGSIQSELAKALGDPGLQVLYWLPERGAFVDADGVAVAEPAATQTRGLVRLTRSNQTIAIVSHAGKVADLERELGPALRLGLENERLQAQVLAQLEDLRESRARIVRAADDERRVLERDLHDGAQQHLLALTLNLRLARSRAAAARETAAETALITAINEAEAALEELRELAHGIFPAVLTSDGLGAALDSLAETAPIPVQVRGADYRRYPAVAESAAYFGCVQALEDAIGRHAGHVIVTIAYTNGGLRVKIDDDGAGRTAELMQVMDRVGAMGGTVEALPWSCRLEIPCKPVSEVDQHPAEALADAAHTKRGD